MKLLNYCKRAQYQTPEMEVLRRTLGLTEREAAKMQAREVLDRMLDNVPEEVYDGALQSGNKKYLQRSGWNLLRRGSEIMPHGESWLQYREVDNVLPRLNDVRRAYLAGSQTGDSELVRRASEQYVKLDPVGACNLGRNTGDRELTLMAAEELLSQGDVERARDELLNLLHATSSELRRGQSSTPSL
ncbi:MAG: hypothetical protein HYX24_03560 [Candidatus Aenigmarchaeota archaeon]|nr:hypothetical protein [Candidatus Aenigmarchaeota archaeon]